MHRLIGSAAAAACLSLAGSALASDWLNLSNETATRLQVATTLGISDPDEKSYAWGDFDQDGDVDMVIARKRPMAFAGKRANVLLMNEDGNLVDRTSQFASASTVAGDQGFLTLTDDRDIEAHDLNADGWLDLVTATTYGQLDPASIYNPRIYINLGKVAGVWQGFRFEDTRISLPAAPNFCNVAVGDVTGDDSPDLYFVDYDGGYGPGPSPFDDRLFVNDGNGFFTDQTTTRITVPAFYDSAFGTSAVIGDFNGDGWGDIAKSEDGPSELIYNNGSGQLTNYQPGLGSATYHFSVADMNDDGKLDLLMSDDGIDRWLKNNGPAPSGQVNWQSFSFPSSTSGFGSNSYGIDMNNDGVKEYFVASVDARDDPSNGCSGNIGDLCRGALTGATYSWSYDWANIPQNFHTNTYDYAIFDIDGDCWTDLVIGTCNGGSTAQTIGTSVWMNIPPDGAETCKATDCPADFSGDGSVGGIDLAQLLGAWGPCPAPCTFDLNKDGAVGGIDLATLLGAWGPCGK